MDILTSALFLAVVNNKMIDYIVTPIKQNFPDMKFYWLVYVALITGFALSMASGINLFADYIPNTLVGQVLSGIVVGGGSSLIHDIFDNKEVITQ